MEKLPDVLVCLTLQHIIDKRNAVEVLLSERTDAVEKCLPVALKEVFSMPTIPDSSITLKYLTALWTGDYSCNSYIDAARQGLIYLLPFINPSPNDLWARRALLAAAAGGQLDVVKYLLNGQLHNEIPDSLLTSAAISNSLDTLNYVLSLGGTYVHPNALLLALQEAANTANSTMTKRLVAEVKSRFPAVDARDIIQNAFDTVRSNKRYILHLIKSYGAKENPKRGDEVISILKDALS